MKIIITAALEWFGKRIRINIFLFCVSSSSLTPQPQPPPYVCSHQFLGDFYKSFVSHKKIRCKGRQKNMGLTCVFSFSLQTHACAHAIPERRFVYFIINTNIANTSSIRLSDLHHLYRCQKKKQNEHKKKEIIYNLRYTMSHIYV